VREILYDVRVRKVLGQFSGAVLPHMLSIVDGAPDERRRYLNLALSRWASYERVLTMQPALTAQRAAETDFDRQSDPGQLDFGTR
jgi:recombinational DNA repair ATPase RecF